MSRMEKYVSPNKYVNYQRRDGMSLLTVASKTDVSSSSAKIQNLKKKKQHENINLKLSAKWIFAAKRVFGKEMIY